MDLAFAGKFFDKREGFKYRAGIGFTATQIIDFSTAGILIKGVNEASHIFGMDVISYLLAFVAKYLVFLPLQITLDQIAEKAV